MQVRHFDEGHITDGSGRTESDEEPDEDSDDEPDTTMGSVVKFFKEKISIF